MKFDLKAIGARAEEFAPLAAEALEVVGALVGGVVGGDLAKAADVVTVIKVIISEVEGAYRGTVTPQAVADEIRKLHAQISANDAKADEALKKKFPT